MLDLSFAEILLIVVVAVVFIGPKELPAVVRAVARALKSLRGMGRDIHKLFDELTKESGLKDVEHEMQMIQGDDGKLYEALVKKGDD